MREAGIGPEQIDLVIPFGLGWRESDSAEAAALRTVFGDRLTHVPVVSIKPIFGNCGAGSGSLDVCIAARALAEQTLPPVINRESPLADLQAGSPTATQADLRHVLTFSSSHGGQNAALVLKRV
jgi:3-oxoacyl-[acyl-carrier-protein] synthase II